MVFIVKAHLEECEYLGFNCRPSDFKDSCKDLVLARGSVSSFKYSFIDVCDCNRWEVDFIDGCSK